MLPAVTLAELHAADGVRDPSRILISLLGIVFDCSTEAGLEFFGPAGPYKSFAGRDASYSLSAMSLKAEDVDKFDFAADSDSLQTLAEWIAYFDSTYKRVGWLTGCPEHSLKISALPPVAAKKLGDTTYGGGEEQQQKEGNIAAQKEYDLVFEAAGGAQAPAAGGVSHQVKADGADAERLSMFLFNGCKVQHTSVMRTELMSQCIDGTVPRATYTRYLASLYHVYSELEPQIAAHASLRYLDGMHDERLLRLPNLREDLLFYLGDAWELRLPPAVDAAVEYAARIRAMAGQPHLLAVHHWLRYGAGMAGGQFLRGSLARGLHLKANDGGRKTPGIRYNEFDDLDLDDGEFYRQYLAALDSAGVSSKSLGEWQAMAEEAKWTFGINIRMNDEVISGKRAKTQEPPTAPTAPTDISAKL